VTSLFTRAAHAGGIFKLRHAEWDAQIFAIACLQGGAIALGQASLKMNSVGFFQITKQMQVPLVACIEYVKLGRKITRRKIVLLCAMTAGVAVACASDVKFTFVGAFIAAAGVACTSVEIVLYSHLQQAHGWETLQLLYNTMPYCSAFMIVLAGYQDWGILKGWLALGGPGGVGGGGGGGGGSGVVVETEGGGEAAGFRMDGTGGFLFACSCALGLAVNVSSCFVGGKASALVYSMLGLAKTITILILGVMFFDAPPSARQDAGIAVAVASICWYTAVTLEEKRKAAATAATTSDVGRKSSGDGDASKP
jgi:solute carrier family 35 protein E3